METTRNKRKTRSIRAMLWQGIGGIAVLTFVGSIGSYLIVSGLTSNSLLPAGIAAIVTAISMATLGRSFAERIASSVDAANFAAKSSERNPSASVPAATGISETDEILLCIHRSNRQLISYASLMEMVAAGNTSEAVMPLDSPDKLTTSFQKLVQKVAESVDAKRDLDELRKALADLEAQLPGLFEIRPYREVHGPEAVAAIVDALNELAIRADRELRAVKSGISDAQSILLSANLGIRNGVLSSETSVQSLSRAVSALKAQPDHVKAIAEICEPAITAAEKAALSFQEGLEAGRSLTGKAAHIHRQQNELGRKMRKLRERAQSISDAARSVEDLARRSNLLALNTSIQADNRSDSSAIGSEFRALSDRASRAQKEITDIERSLSQEIDDTDTILRFLLAESTNVGDQLASLLELVEKFDPVVNGLSGVSDLITNLRNKNTIDREELTRAITACYFDLEKIGPQLRETEHAITGARNVFEQASSEVRHDAFPSQTRFETAVTSGHPPLEFSGEN